MTGQSADCKIRQPCPTDVGAQVVAGGQQLFGASFSVKAAAIREIQVLMQ
jgi:hypothetical protein